MPKKSIGFRPKRSWNHTLKQVEDADRESAASRTSRCPARRGYSGTGSESSRKPSAAAITTMYRCQSGRSGTPCMTSRRYALTELRSVTRTPNSQRQSAL